MANAHMPPQDLAAERSVIGSMLIARVAIDEASAIVSPGDFYGESHRFIVRAAIDLATRQSGGVDAVTVARELDLRGQLDSVGGPAYLNTCMEFGQPFHAAFYAAIVRDCALRRRTIEIAEAAIRDATRGELQLGELIERIDADLAAVRQPNARGASVTPLRDAQVRYVESMRETKTPARALPTGVPELDESFGGFAPGEMVVVGARPSNGKTLVGLQMLDHAAREGRPVLFVSEETSVEGLAGRTLRSLSETHPDYWHGAEDVLLQQIHTHHETRAVSLVAEGCRKVDRVAQVVERAQREHGVEVVAVDYVQLLEGRGQTMYDQVTYVSRRLKQLCLDTGVTLIVLAQLKREFDPARPKLSDLKNSGSLEQDADVAVFLYYPHGSDRTYQPSNEYWIHVLKCKDREIRTATIKTIIDPVRQRLGMTLSERMNEYLDPTWGTP